MLDGVYDRLLPIRIQQELGESVLKIVGVIAPRELRVARCAKRMRVDLDVAEIEMDFLDDLKRKVGGDELLASANFLVRNTGNIIDARNAIVATVLGATALQSLE